MGNDIEKNSFLNFNFLKSGPYFGYNEMVGILKKYSFEIMVFIIVSIVILAQLGNFGDIGWYLMGLGYFAAFLFIFAFMRRSFLSIFDDIKFSLFSTNFSKMSSIEKSLSLFVMGIFSSFFFAVAEIFSWLFISSQTKPQYLGIPFGFLPLKGKILLTPFIADGVIFTFVLYVYYKLRSNSEK